MNYGYLNHACTPAVPQAWTALTLVKVQTLGFSPNLDRVCVKLRCSHDAIPSEARYWQIVGSRGRFKSERCAAFNMDQSH